MPARPLHPTSRPGWWLAAVVTLAAAALTATGAAPVDADGNEAPSAPPVARAVTAGGEFTCVIDAGVVKCWGDNRDGQLATGTERVGDEFGTGTERVGDGPREMGAALMPVPLGEGRTATAIAAGYRHVCAVLDDGSVKCWGDNEVGQLGQGDTFDRGDQPGEMGDDLPPVPLGTGRTATAVTAGGNHSCALLDDGTVKCWGDNEIGQLGQGDTFDRGDQPGEMGDNLPPIALGTGRTATAITAGGNHTCALLDHGTVKCWGEGRSGQLGQGYIYDRGDQPGEMGDNLPPVDLGTGRTAIAVAAGGYRVYYIYETYQVGGHSCALLDDGTVKCWGANEGGQLGQGDREDRGDEPGEMGDNLPPIALGTGRTATAITVGGIPSYLNPYPGIVSGHSCARLDDGTVKCWGRGDFGQLGQGETVARGDGRNEMGDNLPPIALGTGRTATFVTAGSAHSCAALDNATLKCWGAGGAGQLGLGDTATRADQAGEMGDNLPAVALRGPGVAGAVTVGGTGDDAAGTFVVPLRALDSSIATFGLTNGNGDYGLELPAGSYRLFQVDPTGANTPGLVGAPDTIVVAATTTNRDITVTAATGAVTGTVRDTTTTAPIAGALVFALNPTSYLPEKVTAAAADGTFTLAGLRPGPHHLAYLDPAGAHQVRYHPSAPTLATATTVTVTAAAATNGDGTLPGQTTPAREVALTGTITDRATSSRIPGVVVALDAADYSFLRATTANLNGAYVLHLPADTAVKVLFVDPTGTYAAEWHDDQPATSLAAATIVDPPAIVDAAVDGPGSVDGQVLDHNGQGIGGAWVGIIDPTGTVVATVSTSGANIGTNGQFTINNIPPGTYRAAAAIVRTGIHGYWPDAPDFNHASTFRVRSGDTTHLVSQTLDTP